MPLRLPAPPLAPPPFSIPQLRGDPQGSHPQTPQAPGLPRGPHRPNLQMEELSPGSGPPRPSPEAWPRPRPRPRTPSPHAGHPPQPSGLHGLRARLPGQGLLLSLRGLSGQGFSCGGGCLPLRWLPLGRGCPPPREPPVGGRAQTPASAQRRPAGGPQARDSWSGCLPLRGKLA